MVSDCRWVEPIYFSQPTLEWLSRLEWPESAYEDFNKIYRHNEKYRRIMLNNTNATIQSPNRSKATPKMPGATNPGDSF